MRLTEAGRSLLVYARRVELDVRDVGTPPKDHFARRRPALGNDKPICVPRETWMETNASYPSGHAMVAWTWALITSCQGAGAVSSCAVTTVEALTGLEIGYAAKVEFDGVIALSNAVGGVEASWPVMLWLGAPGSLPMWLDGALASPWDPAGGLLYYDGANLNAMRVAEDRAEVFDDAVSTTVPVETIAEAGPASPCRATRPCAGRTKRTVVWPSASW